MFHLFADLHIDLFLFFFSILLLIITSVQGQALRVALQIVFSLADLSVIFLASPFLFCLPYATDWQQINIECPVIWLAVGPLALSIHWPVFTCRWISRSTMDIHFLSILGKKTVWNRFYFPPLSLIGFTHTRTTDHNTHHRSVSGGLWTLWLFMA